MKRSPVQRISLVAAVLCGMAPLGYGLTLAWTTGSDRHMLWMALVASVFAAGVLTAAIGRRRGRDAVRVEAIVILCVSTLMAGGMGMLLGATSGPGVWAVAVVFGICLAISSVFVSLSRPNAG